jgi:hypothetical protein
LFVATHFNSFIAPSDLTEAIEQLKQHGMLAKKQVTGIGPIYCVTPQVLQPVFFLPIQPFKITFKASIYYHSEYCSAYSRVDVSSKRTVFFFQFNGA